MNYVNDLKRKKESIVAVKVFRTITHNTHIIARDVLCFIRSWNVQAAWCLSKTRPKNICRENTQQHQHQQMGEIMILLWPKKSSLLFSTNLPCKLVPSLQKV